MKKKLLNLTTKKLMEKLFPKPVVRAVDQLADKQKESPREPLASRRPSSSQEDK